MTQTPAPISPSPVRACTISRDVQQFDLLIEDMEALMGEGWGDLGFGEALAFLRQPEAKELEFLALAMDVDDEDELPLLLEILGMATQLRVPVLLVAEDLDPATLHHILRGGATEFVPYPLPEGALAEAVAGLAADEPPAEAPAAPAPSAAPLRNSPRGQGAIIATHGLGGGVGTTTLAVNLAWELATLSKSDAPRVCLIDLGLQFGGVASALDLPKRDTVIDLWSDTAAMDDESFAQALQSYQDKLHVLTAPPELLPLDFIASEDLDKIIDLAAASFDYVILDLPTTLVNWTETALKRAHVWFALLELDMRTAHNTLRMRRALEGEGLPFDKLRFVMNRAPRFTDLSGRSRIKKMAESLNVSIDVLLPDGGRSVTQGADHGQPLAETAAKNPLRKEIAKLAASLHALSDESAKAA